MTTQHVHTAHRPHDREAVVLWCVECSAQEQFDTVHHREDDAKDTALTHDATAPLLFVELLCRGCGSAAVMGMLAALPASARGGRRGSSSLHESA